MASSYDIVKADGSFFTVYSLESDGSSNLSTPRQVLSAVLSGGAGTNYFELGDDLTYRFVPGFTFNVIILDPLSFPVTANEGTYTVAPAGSTFSGTTTSVPVVETIPRGFFTVVGVQVGAKKWIIDGNHAAEFGVGTSFSISGDTATGNGVYTVSVTGAANVGPTTEIIVNETIPATPAADGLLAVDAYDIVGVVPGPGGTWTVAGNVASRLPIGSGFTVSGNSAGDGNYSVTSATNVGPNTNIVITTTIPLLSDTAGSVLVGNIPLGHIQYHVPVGDGGVNTSFDLPGRGTPNWGQSLETNQVRDLEHFANTTPPPAPMTGQLWYDTGTPGLFLFASTVYTVAAVDNVGPTYSWTLDSSHGDVTALFTAGAKFTVYGNAGIDEANILAPGLYPASGLYQVLSSSFGGGQTTINVDTTVLAPLSNSIPAEATADGRLYLMTDWHQVAMYSDVFILDVKASCLAATDTALPAYTGAGAGATRTLTATVNALLLVDGVNTWVDIDNDGGSINPGDPFPASRVLVKDPAGSTDNGIYAVKDKGSGGTPWILIRAGDANNTPSNEVTSGMFTFIEDGTLNLNSGWTLVTDDPIILDTTPLTFVRFTTVSEPDTQIVFGTGPGTSVTSSPTFTYDYVPTGSGALTFNPGLVAAPGDVSITAAGSNAATGGAMLLQSGAGFGANAGGAILVQPGDAGATAVVGGTLTLQAGAGGATTGIGGNAQLIGGAAPGTGNGGIVSVLGGTPTDGDGGRIDVIAASGVGTDRNGGDVNVTAGTATGTGTNGIVTLTGGNGDYIEVGASINIIGITQTGGSTVTINAGANTSGNGGQVNIAAGNSTGGATGGGINITAGDSPFPETGNGGDISIGAGSATNLGVGTTGGNVTIQGGSSATFNGGQVTLVAGSGTSPGNGGIATVRGGSAATTVGGLAQIEGGAGGATGGEVQVLGGASTGGTGGAVTVTAGAGGTTGIGNGGTVTITGGLGGITSGNGGAVNIFGGLSNDGNGGAIAISGRQATGTNRSGGNVAISAGANTGTGTAGTVTIDGGNGGAFGGTVVGGNVVVTGGPGGTNSAGGYVSLVGGQGDGTGTGGALAFTAGAAGATGLGGNINIIAGAGGSTSGNSGAVFISSGTPLNGSANGVQLIAADGAGVGNNGGDIGIFSGGASDATGTPGIIEEITKAGYWRQQSGNIVGALDAISNQYIVRTATANAASTELYLDGTGGTRRMVLANATAWRFEIHLVAVETAGANVGWAAAYEIKGLIKNIGGTTAFVGVPTVNVTGDDSAGVWTANVTADDPNNALVISVTGQAATTIHWVAYIRTVQVI